MEHIRTSGQWKKISLENVGREANDSNESHGDLASFQ